jgi:3-deoxy-manno-octulosonate cytidylyltransferase (CMP-KDO synthetase)
MKVAAVIPARIGSSRFPGKPLALICGKPMIQHVYENATACSLIERVVVAADDPAVQQAVQAFGGEVAMTSSDHQTGTDRVAEVAQTLDAGIIVNIQGDEPLLPPDAIADAIRPLLQDERIVMSTLKTALRPEDDPRDPNIVKVTTDAHGLALYFSRAPIPFQRDDGPCSQMYRHIGLYVFRRNFLFDYTKLPQTPLELAESLEQLRALEHGYSIFVSETRYYPLGVDAPSDIERAEASLRAQS